MKPIPAIPIPNAMSEPREIPQPPAASLSRRHLLAGLALAGGLAGGLRPAAAAPKAELWAVWQPHNAASTVQVDHTLWDTLLARHVRVGDDGIARVDYTRFAGESRAMLQRYLRDLAAVPVASLDRAEQMAFWINLYNALTVQVIVEHYPVSTIRDIDISPGWFADGPWGRKLIRIAGQELSLDDIEHRILRPIWRDPRIHYAVNCASLGCPNLQDRAFVAAMLDKQLERAARQFVNHPRAASLSQGRLTVSSIYRWFREDFGDSETGVISHLRQFADSGLSAALAGVSEIDDDRYDWQLNDLAVRSDRDAS